MKPIVVVLSLLLVLSCKKEKPAATQTDEGTYFSIIQYTQDHWHMYWGTPISFQKTVTLNGKSDTAFISGAKTDWGALIDVFFKADISDKKYIGLYNFSQFEDATTNTINYYYEAKNKSLFTRKFHIIADRDSKKIVSLYAETADESGWGTRSQKLFYAPLKSIQIQEYEKPAVGPAKDLRIEYRFLLSRDT